MGFILPISGETRSIGVTKERGEYVVTLTADYMPCAGINKYDETGGYALNSVTCGCRIYTDAAHGFAGVEQAAAVQRDPLSVTADSGTAVVYEALRGCCTVRLPGTRFQYACENPDVRFPVTLHVPGADDRDVYIRAAAENRARRKRKGILQGQGSFFVREIFCPGEFPFVREGSPFDREDLFRFPVRRPQGPGAYPLKAYVRIAVSEANATSR